MDAGRRVCRSRRVQQGAPLGSGPEPPAETTTTSFEVISVCAMMRTV